MQVLEFFLPNRLYQGGGHKAAGNEFDDRSEEDTDETAPSCFEGFGELFSGDEFAKDCAYKRTKDDTYRAKEKSDENADSTTPHSPFSSAVVLGTPCRDNIIQNGDD